MSEQDTEQEPSIEEILTSIRQIISDDDDEGAEEEAVEAATPEPEPAPEPEPEEDVIELTDKVDDPEPEPITEPEPEPTPEPEPEPTPEPEEEIEVIQVDMQDSVPEPETIAEVDDGILTNAAETAAFDAFSDLAKKTAIEHGGITVEEIVRSELKPLLKDWLDKHLPFIIERLVQEELERVSKRAMDE